MSIASAFRTQGKKIVAYGRTYADHIKELNNATPSEPFFFLKPTSSYTQGALEIPRGVTVHHEVELGVVIGRTGREITKEDAMDYVAGYTLAIDYTGRNVQDAAKAKGLPWSAAKGFDTFTSVASFIPRSAIKDPHAVELWYSLNGIERQRASTGLMMYTVPELIAHASSVMTLEEGDLLLTGTPAGVGQVKPGDQVEAGLEQDGKSLLTIQHLAKLRTGGYTFQPQEGK